MPNVCVCDCGLTVNSGELCLDWHAVGEKTGRTDVSGIDTSEAETNDWTQIQFLRLQYCNDTCITQIVQVSAFVGYCNMNQAEAGNYWDFAVYAGVTFDAPVPSNSFSLNAAGRLRKNNGSGNMERISAPVRTADQVFAVAPGRCLHMIGSTWKNIYQSTGAPLNELSYNRLELNYRVHPSIV